MAIAGFGTECDPDADDGGTDPSREVVPFVVPEVGAEASSTAPGGVTIYYDGTPSMRGFLADERYRRLVTHSISYAVNSNLPVNYIQASNQGAQGVLHPMDSALEAGRTELYLRGDSDVRTVVDSARTDRMNVIVTDFFETNQELPRINRTLASRFIAEGHAVGLIGMRFQFDGLVYDVGLDLETFRYAGLRPLYILAIGERKTVQRFMDNLQLDGVEMERALFTADVLETPLRTRDFRVEEQAGFIEATVLEDASIPGQFLIRSPTDTARMTTVAEANVVDFTDGASAIRTTVDRAVHTPVRSTSAMNHEDARDRLDVRAGLQDGNFRHELSLPLQGLDRGRYRFDISFSAERTQTPEWIRDWTMDLSDLPGWISTPESFDGSQTQYLEDFTDRLLRDIHEIQQPTYGEINLYVKYDG